MPLTLCRYLLFLTLVLQSAQIVAQQPPYEEADETSLVRFSDSAPLDEPDELVRLAAHHGPAILPGRAARSGDPARCWYFQTKYLTLRRSRPRTDHFTTDQYSNPDNVVLGTDNLDFSDEPAMRFVLGRTCRAGELSIEFSCFSMLNRWSGAASYTDENPYGGLESNLMATFFCDAGASWSTFDTFRGAGTQSIRYTSDLRDYQLNVQRHYQPWLSSSGRSLVGVRLVTLDEDFAFLSDNVNAGEIGQYLIATENTLLGLQIGGDLAWHVSPRTAICLRAKGSLLVNFSSQNSRLINSDTGAGYDLPINTGDITNGQLASLVETGLSFHWAISQRLELQLGYDVTLISGLALAPEQFDHTIGLTMARKIDTSGQLLVHGPSAGGTFRW